MLRTSLIVLLLAGCATPQEPPNLDGDVAQEVLEFASDPRYPFFPKLRQQMAELLETKRADNLAQAYALACVKDDECAKHHGVD